MKVRALIFAAGIATAASLHAGSDATPQQARAVILKGIRQVEGVKYPGRRGPAGELGYFRITAGVWAQHTRKPFALCATDHALELAVADKHLDWLARQLRRRGIRPTPYRLAYGWVAGLEAACAEISHIAAAADYASRVQNLCIR